MEKLQTLIDILTYNSGIHVSVLDVSGILNTPLAELEYKNVIHSISFCNVAKSTENGFRLCLYCKGLANKKAIESKASFCGTCAYGLYEAAIPVVIGGATAAIVYVGNAILNEADTRKKMAAACARSGVKLDLIESELKFAERINSPNELFSIGNIVRDYIKLIHSSEEGRQTQTHWLVQTMIRHAEGSISSGTTLKELALLYNKNEKYMGRLFNEKMGISFSKYCLYLRLAKAEELLCKTQKKIIDIALECGFDNISYFNRTFKKRFGKSPGEYRCS